MLVLLSRSHFFQNIFFHIQGQEWRVHVENTIAKGQEYSSIFTCLWFFELTRMISCYDWKQKPVKKISFGKSNATS